MNTKEISNVLLESNIKPSYPRIHIYKYLSTSRDHPTADDIYNQVIDIIPTLSKTTVYNTLNLFEEKNLVNSIRLKDNEKHYEIIFDEHAHFKCEVCGRIYDIPYEVNNILDEEHKNFIINNKEVLLSGICGTCNK